MSRFPHPGMNRKDWMEKHIIARRNREDALREVWKNAEKYFKTCDVKANMYSTLSSQETYQLSMNAYQEKKHRETEEQALDERRKKLTALLQRETDQYEMELKELLGQRWYKQHQVSVIGSTSPLILVASGQASSNAPCTPSAKPLHWFAGDGSSSAVGDEVSRLPSASRPENAGLPSAVGENSRVLSPVRAERDDPEACRSAEALLHQVKQSEREAAQLKQGQVVLQQCLNDLQEKVVQRFHLTKQQRRVNCSKQLMRPYKVQIQLRTRNVIESLEFDVKLIEGILHLLRKADVDDGAFCQDLEKFKMQMMQDICHENSQLLRSENLFHEEAERLWKRRVLEWDDEQTSRDSLIDKMVRLLESRLRSKLALCLERQQENIGARENLLHGLESSVGRCEGRKLPRPSVKGRYISNETTAESSRHLGDPKNPAFPAIERLHL